MALFLPGGGGCVGLRFHSRPVCARRRPAVFATLSQPRGDEVDWVEATSSFFEKDSRPIMLFDGVCNLCNGGVKFVRDNDRNSMKKLQTLEYLATARMTNRPFSMLIMRFEPLQSEAGKKLLRRSGRAPDDISSVVLVDNDRSYVKSEAVLKIMEYIDVPFPQLAFFLKFMPLFIRDFAYDNIANNRYTFFGRSESCEI
ncbi:Dcc family protein chloroplastic-like [Quillaja saponaria]|uniref:Dcc family protein chloroplastic-like n=1 Tax=Quillaja saponaria TaxID=32244 RepID=A0AAD7L5P0_QUISA|nr:Dcc family protein chloroplastic-like [Quillaja saponaria]